jgi:hypothetical protein
MIFASVKNDGPTDCPECQGRGSWFDRDDDGQGRQGHCYECGGFGMVGQHPSNPILVDFREHKNDGPVGYVVGGALEKVPGTYATFSRHHPSPIEHYLIQLRGAERQPILTEIGLGVKATRPQIEHARAVLTRLARLGDHAPA